MNIDASTDKQWSILAMNTSAYMVNFAVWTMFSIIGVQIKEELQLSGGEFGLLVSAPIFSGAIARIPLGFLTDYFGGRRVFVLQMLVVAAACFAVPYCTTFVEYLIAGVLVGLSGGAFAIGIAYTSACFSGERQGLAMGIFSAGDIGAALTNLVAPMILLAYGWAMMPKAYGALMLLMALLFLLFSYPDAERQSKRERRQQARGWQLSLLRDLRVWRLSLYYFFVFGGFVALALWLPQYYMDAFALPLASASLLTLSFTLTAGLVSAIGGWLADIYSARSVNWWVFWVCIVCLFFLSYPPTTMLIHGDNREITIDIGHSLWSFNALIFVMAAAMGFGKASIYRMIHDEFPGRVGLVGGHVGAIGALGGFMLPVVFGLISDLTNVRSSCFMFLYGLLGVCMFSMHYAIKAEQHLERLRYAQNSDFLRY